MRLHQSFSAALECRRGYAVEEFSAMIHKPAKSIGEMRSLLVELERRMKNVLEIVGEEVGTMHAKSVLTAILDPITKQHTVQYQGGTGKEDFEAYKRKVREFVNGASGADGKDPNAMQIGAIIGQTRKEEERGLWGDGRRGV